MLITRRKKHGVNFIKVWWAKEPLKESGIIQYHQAIGEWAKNKGDQYDTLVNDITGDDDAIKSYFSKSCKYKVNRAAREDVSIEIKDSSLITNEDIDEFLEFFRAFWESKDVVLNQEEALRMDMREYREMGGLTIAVGKVQNEVAIYHTHVYDEERARLLHSASLYRLQSDEEGNTKNLIGMANRYLHYKEMLFFRDKGLSIYDWGGAGRGEDVIHITEFKESFGGEPEVDYDFEESRGVAAACFKLAVKLFKK